LNNMLIVIMHYANTIGLKKTLQKGGKRGFFRRHRKKLLGLGAGAAALGGLAMTGGLAGLPALGAAGMGAAKSAGAAVAAKTAEGLARAKPIAQRVASQLVEKAQPKLREAAQKTVEKTAQGFMGAKQMASDAAPVVQEGIQRVGQGMVNVQERVAPVVQEGIQRVGEGMDAFAAHPATLNAVDAAKRTGVKIIQEAVTGTSPDAATRILSSAVVAAVNTLVDPRKRKVEDGEAQPAKKTRTEAAQVDAPEAAQVAEAGMEDDEDEGIPLRPPQ
jgi:hypothetical protein